MGIKNLKGIEINPEAVKIAKDQLSHIQHHEIIHDSAENLPFESQSIDTVLCSEVLEHIPNELRSQVIQSIHRVLIPHGTLILTVPYQGAFSCLDPANIRFRLPKIFRWISQLLGGKGRDAGFIGQKQGIIWHHHFKLSELEQLLTPDFKIKQIRWRGCLLTPLCGYLAFPFYRKGWFDHPILQFIQAIETLEMQVQFGPFWSYNILIVAQKNQTQESQLK